jgi:hypothetical protein
MILTRPKRNFSVGLQWGRSLCSKAFKTMVQVRSPPRTRPTTALAKNAEFAACVMYVLGAVDMLREWQKIDPVHALPVCVPRTVSAGGLILEIQKYIEADRPWQRQQVDAATAVIAALASTWPCERRR